MQDLNSKYRKKNRPTDVLAFPQTSISVSPKRMLGDIVVCGTVARQQAKETNRPLQEELALLLVHGLLHLLGHDHHKRQEAKLMFTLQDRILTGFHQK